MATTETTTCSTCGAANRPERKFCAECGSSLGAVCPSCGTANEIGERFCGECGTPLDAGALAATPAVSVERRLVSVLFADLVGFTPLSEDRDAEEVRDLLSRYFELSAEVIGRYGGVVEKFIGDAVMAVWGTPVAQEDDAERAVRAALDLVASVSEFGSDSGLPDLAARAAVLTGEAAVNLGAAGQGMVAGDLVNAASRAQSVAEPHTVLAGDSTRRATDAAIAYADAGVHELKGKAESLQLWRALRVTAGRAGGLKSQGLEPPFVGRDRELRLAKELFHASADERKAHLLSIVGIAGIGKSRLSWELYKYLDGITQEVAWHRGRCLAYGDGVTYWALAEMVRMRVGIAEGEDVRSAQEKLDTALADQVVDDDERGWIRLRLSQLLSLESRESGEHADLFAGWRLFFERIAERDPVVLVFEDMQWADAPLLDFVEYLLEWSRNYPILVVALSRPGQAERQTQWTSRLRNATTLSLEPLAGEAMEALLEGFVPGLPENLRRQILDRAEGVPLYAVETVRMLIDRGLLAQEGDVYTPTGPIEALEVPETLQALIAARLDGLPAEERSVLQDAAVLGKSFTKAALTAVSGLEESELDGVLLALVRKEVLSLQADPRSPERGQHSFLQDLLRQVAYETLSRKERRARHLAAASYLENGLEEDDELVEIVASHIVSALELGPDADDAQELRTRAEAILSQAGERAATLGANESAQRYFERALELADTPLRAAELHERAGEMATFGLRAPDARAHFEHAIEGFEGIGLTHPAARVRSRLGLLVWQLEGDLAKAITFLESAFDVLVADEHDADLAHLAISIARLYFFSGRHDEAMARNELALEIAESLELAEALSQGLNTKGLILSARGRPEEGWLLVQHALEVALAHDLSSAAVRAYSNATSLVVMRDRAREALALALRGQELARKVGDRGSEMNLTGWVLGIRASLGEWDTVLAEDTALEVEDATSVPVDGIVIPILVDRGQLDEARHRFELSVRFLDPDEVQDVAGFKMTESHILLAEGRLRDALAAAEEAVARRGELAEGLAAVKLGYTLALAAAFELGDDARVDELLAIVERLPPGELSPYLRATGARFSARRAARISDNETAVAGFSAAAGILQAIEYPFDYAVVLLEHAEWLVAEGRSDEAAPLAVEAREIFERLQAAPYLERVDRLPLGATASVS